MTTSKHLSTFDGEMENDRKSVRKPAKQVGLSPTVIQKLRTRKQDDVKLSNFINISHARI